MSDRRQPKRTNPFDVARGIAFGSAPVIYVSGPVTGRADLNRPAFVEAQRRLKAAGFYAIIPHNVVPADASWLSAMAKCVTVMADADGVALLDDWETSDGAKIEALLAERGGLPVASVDEWCEPIKEAS